MPARSSPRAARREHQKQRAPAHELSLEVAEAKPFLKWAGGKWTLASQILPLLPPVAGRTYREPFLGGGAIYFKLRGSTPPSRAVLSDAQGDLVRTYEVVRDAPDALVERLEELGRQHSKRHFYDVRKRFNTPALGESVERAAWLIYLNKTCFNGLFRTNKSGEFNVPIGRFDNPRIVDEPRIRAASAALRGAHLATSGYDHLLEEAEPGDVVYLDPPYVPLSKTSSFAAYSLAFGPDEQAHLADTFRQLDARGCLLALSNSDTPDVRKLYKGFELTEIDAARSIGSRGESRVRVTELLVRNVKKYRG
ncbi:MAG TPA: DNA adenine methylase [Polyangiaceae bacterium]|jgi:DNA adenine methylase|nr:DNA adenine methylase [Polyangiaceae bacterium]